MKLSSGVDLIEIERLEQVIERHGRRFLERVYTQQELEEAGNSLQTLAGRFAAKEATAKALGTGIGAIAWREIEIRRGPQREPLLCLHGAAQDLARAQGLQTWSVSVSHSVHFAVAMVVAIGE